MSATSPVVVAARWVLEPGDVDRVLEWVRELKHRTLAEPGCLAYDVFRSVDAAGELLLLERYRDGAAVEAHRGSSHYRDILVERIGPVLVERHVTLLGALETP